MRHTTVWKTKNQIEFGWSNIIAPYFTQAWRLRRIQFKDIFIMIPHIWKLYFKNHKLAEKLEDPLAGAPSTHAQMSCIFRIRKSIY